MRHQGPAVLGVLDLSLCGATLALPGVLDRAVAPAMQGSAAAGALDLALAVLGMGGAPGPVVCGVRLGSGHGRARHIQVCRTA
jgi:hypothetical protein